jgi:putative membrane protein
LPEERGVAPLPDPGPQPPSGEPDYRFTLANERTFLAWIRTAVAFAAGGIAVVGLVPDATGSGVLAVSLLTLSGVIAAGAYRRWHLNEAAMRRGSRLPASQLPRVITVGTAGAAVLAAIIFLINR